MNYLGLMSVILWLSACGGSASDQSEASVTAIDERQLLTAVTAEKDLPTCDASMEGRVAYVSITKVIYTCLSASWTAVDLKGAEGSDGISALVKIDDEGASSHCAAGGKAIKIGLDEDGDGVLGESEVGATEYVCHGSQGATGATGANGTDNRIVKSFHCSGTIDASNAQDLSISSGSPIDIDYSAAKFSSGDVYVTASIANASYQTSKSQLYSNSQNGSTNASVVITDDYYGAFDYGWWNLAINLDTGIPSATFNNLTLPNSSTRTWTFTACTVNTY